MNPPATTTGTLSTVSTTPLFTTGRCLVDFPAGLRLPSPHEPFFFPSPWTGVTSPLLRKRLTVLEAGDHPFAMWPSQAGNAILHGSSRPGRTPTSRDGARRGGRFQPPEPTKPAGTEVAPSGRQRARERERATFGRARSGVVHLRVF